MNPSLGKGRAALFAGAAAAGLAIHGLLLYPGFLNGDAQWQLDQARKMQFHDWHPALMSLVWHYLDCLIPGAGGIFLFHDLLFWIGLAVLAVSLFESRSSGATYMLAFGLYPPILLALMTIVKDAGLIASLLTACGMLALAERSGSRFAFLMSLGALFYGMGLRHNAPFAVLPLSLWAGKIAQDPRIVPSPAASAFISRIGGLASGSALFFLLWASLAGLNYGILDTQRGFESQLVLVFDVAGVSVSAGKNYLPDAYDQAYYPEGNKLTVEDLKQVYDPNDAGPLLWVPPGKRGPGFLWTGDQYSALLRAWLVVVSTETKAYLKHRGNVFLRLLGLGVSENWPYWLPSPEQAMAEGSFNAAVKGRMIALHLRFRNSWMFKAWFYLALLIASLIMKARSGAGRSPMLWAVGGSGLLYEMAYFFIAPGRDFRFSWWCVCCVGIVLALPSRASR